MPYRTDLKRPDLKGQFPCSVCNKIFCHSSSLSRHRMQAHYKCYICTQCNQEIHSSETLRSHMYRCHSIQRMFMCRCCNWAFPDKTSLHIHMQSMQKSGKPGDVSVLARSSLEESEMVAAEAERERYGSPSNSSPDEEHHLYRGDSISPSISEMEEQNNHHQQHNDLQQHPHTQQQIKTEESTNTAIQHHFNNAHPPHLLAQQQNINNATGIFPNQMEAAPPQSAEFLLSKFGIKPEPTEAPQPPPSINSHPSIMPQSSIPPPLSIFHHHQQPWFGQLLANNPYFASVLEQKAQQQQQNGCVPFNQNNNAKFIQSFCAALASAAASRVQQQNAMNMAKLNNNISQQSTEIPPSMLQPPPQKKQRRKKEKAGGGHIHPKSIEDLSLQIPQHPHPQNAASFAGVSPAMSEGSNAGKLNSLISNLLSIRGSGQNSPAEEDGKEASTHSSSAMSERKNKRKMRTPTRTTAEMTEIIYGDELMEGELPEQSADITFPYIQRFMEKSQETGVGGTKQDSTTNDQQPSPAVSDSQTSGSINGGNLDGAMISPKKCDNCQVAKFNPSETMMNAAKFNEQIQQVAEHISLISESINEVEKREELMACARQLRTLLG